MSQHQRGIGLSHNSGGSSSTTFNYASKLKRLLLPTSTASKDDELLLDTALTPDHPLTPNGISSRHVIPASSINIQNKLGVGEFGVVQQAIWTTNRNNEKIQVAVKLLSKEHMAPNQTNEFMKEYDIMESIEHPHIVRLYGIVLDSPSSIMLVTELAAMRSLLECLREPCFELGLDTLSVFVCQICHGMAYLEAKRLIHRDLAARNILVFSKDIVKISDFGLSRALGVGKDYYQTDFNLNLKLPIAWCAPECINFLRFTSASDVWALGVVMWEIFSFGLQPWASFNGQQILAMIDEPKCGRLQQPLHCPADHYELMLECWHRDPLQRPTFDKLCSLLEEARPEKVEAIRKSQFSLDFIAGTVITVLDKRRRHQQSKGPHLWLGATPNGRVGVFSPDDTVGYLGCPLPSTAATDSSYHAQWQFDRPNTIHRKINRDMIGQPCGELVHLAHLGADGAFFGDVGLPANSGAETMPLLVPELPSVSNFHQYHSIDPTTTTNQAPQPFDMGPSLMDEVFRELDDLSSVSTKVPADEKEAENQSSSAFLQLGPLCRGAAKDLKEKVSHTLSHKRKDTPPSSLIKTINSNDERTLESAIAMANALASQSMHDLDRRCSDQPSSSPLMSSPNSPAAKTSCKHFSFKFPGSSTHGSGSKRFFSDQIDACPSLEETVTTSARDAYRSLIHGTPAATVDTINKLPLPPKSGAVMEVGKRHVRRNPLIICPAGTATNLFVKRGQPIALSADLKTRNFIHTDANL